MTDDRNREPRPYTPVQRHVLGALGRNGGDALVPTSVIEELAGDLDQRLSRIVDGRMPPSASLWVGKTQLQQIEDCEARWEADERHRFRWSIGAARGTVAHRAIELWANWPGVTEPVAIVDEAVRRLVETDGSIGRYLGSLPPVELAELRQSAVAVVSAFEECFPPLQPRWRPVVEGATRVEFAGGRVVLAGRPDLTLGRANAGGKVIVDLKTGQALPHHVDDLRFYALVDACKVGIAPRRVATMYLDSGRPEVESVTADSLRAAADRVVSAVGAMVAIRSRSRPAERSPGPACGWCPAAAHCTAARRPGDGAVDEQPPFWWAPSPALFLLPPPADAA